jgi:hypothetical protein
MPALPDLVTAHPDAGQQPVDGEAETFQGGGEEQVVLVAVAAAPLADEFALHTVDVHPDALAERKRQALKRDRRRVRTVHQPQRLGGGGTGPRIADPGEIGIQPTSTSSGRGSC